MNIEKGKIIELSDNKEYYIIDKINLKEHCYLYISSLNPTSGDDICFVEYINNSIYPITNDSILKDLLLIVVKNNGN